MSITVVRAVVDAWNRKDADGIAMHFVPDGVWHNIPMQPTHGQDAIRQAVARFLMRVERVDWRITAIATTDDGAVLTERRDIFHLPSGRTVDLPVMGIFEFKDDKIVSWRDYFDLATLQAAMG